MENLPIEGAPQLAQSLRHFADGMHQILGNVWNTAQAELLKLPKALVKEVWNKRREYTIMGLTNPMEGLTPEQQVANKWIGQLYSRVREKHNATAGEDTGRRYMGHNDNYVSDSILPDAVEASKNPEVREKLVKEFVEYNNDIFARRGEEFDHAAAEDYIRKYLRAAKTGMGMGEFNALVKEAREYFLPDSMREMDPIRAMDRYARRSAMDIARAVYIEPIKRNMELLGIKTADNAISENDDVGIPALDAAKHQVYGTKGDAQRSVRGKILHAIQSIVYGGAMQTRTGARNYIEGPARAIPGGASLPQVLKANTMVLAEWNRMQHKALEGGATSARLTELRLPGPLSTPVNYFMEMSDNIRNALSKMTFGQTIENASRVRDYAQGEFLAKEAERTGDQKFWADYGGGILPTDSREERIAKAAANFVRHVQGGYDMTDLPFWLIDNSTTAQLMRLHRYNWGAMNRLYQDTIVPAKRGNLFPLMSYLAAAWGVGELKKEMDKQLTGLPSSNLTLAETKELTNSDDLELALTIAEGADNAGFFGIIGSMLSAAAKGIRGKKTSMFVDPAIDYVWNGVLINIAQTFAEAKDGTDAARILANAFKRGTIDAMQNGRLIEAMLMSKEEKVLKAANQTRLAAEGVSPVNERGGPERMVQNLFPNLSPDARPHALREGLIKGEDWAWRQFYKLAETDPLRAQQVQRELKPQAPFYTGNSPQAAVNNQLLTRLLQRRGLFQPTLDAIQARGEGMSNAAQRTAPLP